MVDNANVKELWGVEFRLVPDGLAEEDVVSFVNDLQDKRKQGKGDGEGQASLVKLAEQTVIEADRLAENIKDQARQEAEEQAAAILAASRKGATEEARELVDKAQREVTVQTEAVVSKAKKDADDIVSKARRDAEQVLQSARDQLPGIESEAKLQAEYLVRRFTVQFVEQIRAVVTETSNNMLPSLDALTKDAGRSDAVEDASEHKAVTSSAKSKTKSSSQR